MSFESNEAKVNLAKAFLKLPHVSSTCMLSFFLHWDSSVACHSEICFCSFALSNLHQLFLSVFRGFRTHLRVRSSFCPFVVQTHTCVVNSILASFTSFATTSCQRPKISRALQQWSSLNWWMEVVTFSGRENVELETLLLSSNASGIVGCQKTFQR